MTEITEIKPISINYKISTITMTMQFPDCEFNLNNIGRYLEIDDTILGIKYHYGNSSIIKGKYLTSVYKKSKSKNDMKINKKLFYNQVSLIIKHNIDKNTDNTVNVKIFRNGSLHLTGVKDICEGKQILLIIYNKFKNLKNHLSVILLTKDINNIYLDSSNNIYSITDKNSIGFKIVNSTIYQVNKKEYYFTEIENPNDTNEMIKVFMSNKLESKRTRNILNMDGQNIGFSKINLIRNKSKLYRNNSNVHFDKNFIFYDGIESSTIIGNITYTYQDKTKIKQIEDKMENVIEYNYNCNPFSIEPDEENLNDLDNLNMNINTINIYFKLNFELNRQRLFNKLLELDYILQYTPEKYSGVKLTYKLNKNYFNNGKCLCNKCTCNNITFLIFQSGNIIVTGFKIINDISGVLDHFKVIMDEISSYIIKKKFSID